MILGLLWSAVASAGPPDNVAAVADPRNERFIERERRSRGAYRVASAVGAAGLAIELVGAIKPVREVYVLGGTMEAVAVPAMSVSSLTSALALRKLSDSPSAALGWVATGASAVDLLASLRAAPEDNSLTDEQRRTLARIAIGSRAVALVSAVLQQRSNNRVRRRIGLRVGLRPGDGPDGPSVTISPWLGSGPAGILLTLSDRRGRPAEQPRWTSQP